MNKLSFRESLFEFRRTKVKSKAKHSKKHSKKGGHSQPSGGGGGVQRLRKDSNSTVDKVFETCSMGKLGAKMGLNSNKAVDPHALISYLKERGYAMSEAEIFEICALVTSDDSSGGLLEYNDFIAVLKNCRMKRRADPLLSAAFTQLGADDLKNTIHFSRIMKSIPILKETLGVDTAKFEKFCEGKHEMEDKIDFNEFAAIIVQITSIIEPLPEKPEDKDVKKDAN